MKYSFYTNNKKVVQKTKIKHSLHCNITFSLKVILTILTDF